MKGLSVHILLLLLISSEAARGDSEKVSTKLDFEESKEETNTSQHSPASGGKSSSKHSPKIQGVRVTVDTGKVKKTSTTDSGSKESVEIIESKNKKKVEIHTDITVEISDGENSNGTSTEQDENDASVPIFKGRRTTTYRPRKPYEPPRINPWIPGRSDGSVIHNPHHHGHSNVPVFPRTNDDGIYRSIDSWNNFVPITRVWTTERPYYPPSSYDHLAGVRTYQSYTDSSTQWKPCYCIQGFHRGNKIQSSVQRRSFSGTLDTPKINNKLENPFSSRK